MSASRKSQFEKLSANASTLTPNLRFKFRTLKKDPLQIARAEIPNGAIYVEFVSETNRGWGGFAVISLGGCYQLPSSELRELEQVFINFGFFESPEALLVQIKEKMLLLKSCL